ncbi:hypothetical protein N9948_01295 [bacterium]|nr:hypothetical protein [bacterium]
MGSKLKVDYNDPFFEIIRPETKGICGGCYCCGQQIHIDLEFLDIFPSAKIGGFLYQILMCDLCEEDIAKLKERGIENVSYDILCYIQDVLRERMFEYDEKYGEITEDIRFHILLELYNEFKEKSDKLKG